MFRKLKRTYTHGHLNHTSKFKKEFPELKDVYSEELASRFNRMGLRKTMEFYTEKPTKVSFWLRLTMPFALILMILMFIFSPVNYLLTGSFLYDIKNDSKIINWFRAVKLMC